MTEHDVRNYLRDIYKVPVMDVKTRIVMGEFYKDLHKKYVKKKQDDKFAFVTLVMDNKHFSIHIDAIIYTSLRFYSTATRCQI